MKRLCKGKYVEYIDGKYTIKKFANGICYGFGVDYEEFESGPVMFTTAIVELEDGKIITPVANMIQFVNNMNTESGVV